MTTILLQEFLTGGGIWSAPELLENESLLREGRAMISALTADVAAVADCEATIMRDSRFTDLEFPGCRIMDIGSRDEEHAALCDLSRHFDGVMLIAPETDGQLGSRAKIVTENGGRLFSPSANVIEISADKDRAARWLAERNVPIPRGFSVAANGDLPIWPYRFPVVVKLLDGAGSCDMRLLADPDEFSTWRSDQRAWRLEEFCSGLPASVAVLCGPQGLRPLPACSQRMSDDGQFHYLGGDCPLAAPLNDRAQQLALRAIATLPNPVGYIGVDLILGNDPSGAEDVVIEINPRLTTSYVGLRNLARPNLATAMLAIAQGQPAELSFRAEGVRFDPSGALFDL